MQDMKRARRDAGGLQDWICPSCGNSNYASRNTCNMRKCGAPKPTGPKPIMPQMPYQVPYGAPELGILAAYGGGGMAPLSAPAPYGAPGGIPTIMGYGGPLAAAPVLPLGAYEYGMAPPMFFSEDDRKRRAGAAPLSGLSLNDWICPSCGNRNYSYRTKCNMRSCGQDKPATPTLAVPGGFNGTLPILNFTTGIAPVAAAPPKPAAPEGSWTCKACGNLNYPYRQACNKRSCGVPRGADAGGATGGAAADAKPAATS
eukprot:jgi/Mesvir1/29471/Mv23042-RA.1